MLPNMPFMGVKELALSGGSAILGYSVPKVAGGLGSFVHPIVGALVGIGVGAATVYYSDRVFDNENYAKGAAIGGIIGTIGQAFNAVGQILGYSLGSLIKSKLGMGSIEPVNTRANYVHNPFGQFQQAQAGYGQFQQAQAGYGQFQQAQAGFGEYVQGTGEYVAQDGSMTPVSDFGEYVSQGINVQGYSDYEVMPEYQASADGFGYVNDGVHPNANMDSEFDIIEAAAGLGGGAALGPQPATASDYIPTVQSGGVASQGSNPDAGIFDVGGPNGVFG
jgi:hypothetical protein